MCCLFLVAFFAGPRLALVLVWIFGDRVELAFDTWLWPFLGLLVLPWTTLLGVLAWSPTTGFGGLDWLAVVLGVVLDLMTYSARAASNRYRTA